MDQAHLFAIGVLLAWLAGIRVYLTVFGVGLAGFFGWLDLPQALQAAQSPWVLGTSGVLAAAEFFADKIPGVDSVQLGAGMLATGAGVALTSHLLKSGSRALLNTSPEPVSNWTASVAEDAAVVGGLALAFSHPWLALGMVVAVSLSFALFVWWLWRRLFRRAPRPQAG